MNIEVEWDWIEFEYEWRWILNSDGKVMKNENRSSVRLDWYWFLMKMN